MDNRYGLVRHESGLWRSLRDGDFEEEDVWDVLRDKRYSNSRIESSISVPRTVNLSSAAARMVPSNSYNENRVVHQQSAPLNVPDWSKIWEKRPKKQTKNGGSWHDLDHNDDDGDQRGENLGYSDDEDEADEGACIYKLPPHEVISRRLARSQIPSFSVVEGVGRTLKGRDLSKVRNAILTKTGFLEQP